VWEKRENEKRILRTYESQSSIYGEGNTWETKLLTSKVTWVAKVSDDMERFTNDVSQDNKG
jgi:hypothetical protein